MAISKSNKFIVAVLAAVLACGIMMLAGCSGSASTSSSAATGSSSSSSSSSSAASSSSASGSTSSSSASASSSAAASYVTEPEAGDPYAAGTHHAVVTVEGYDPFTIELDADAAPVSVSNFCKLANAGYYDGLTFYRFVEDFCMQGGTKGNSASGQDASIDKILGEFAVNGVDNPLAADFVKGTVAMARTAVDYNSAGSTFFITLGDQYASALNDQYAAFGMIDDVGMAVVDQIVADCLPNVTDAASGAIADEADQAKISSIEIVD